MLKKILLLGSGELGKELVIALKRLGQTVIAVDSYDGAPAMQVADGREVISMLDGDALDRVIARHAPDIIIPEIEAIRTERLYEHEKRYARRFVLFGTLFFLLGAWFCYEVIFKVGYGFLLRRYQAIDVRPAIRIGEYLSFSSNLLLAFGVIFELPVLAFFLTRIGLIDHRFLIRQFRYAILLIFLVAAILTPPEILSQILLALPLTLLYGVSILVSYLAGTKDRE